MPQRYGLELSAGGQVVDIMLPTPANQVTLEADPRGTFVSFNAENSVLQAGGPYILVAGELTVDTASAAAILLASQRVLIGGLKGQEDGLQSANTDPSFNHLDFSTELSDVAAELSALQTATGG